MAHNRTRLYIRGSYESCDKGSVRGGLACKKKRRSKGLLRRLRRFVREWKVELTLGLAAGAFLMSVVQVILILIHF